MNTLLWTLQIVLAVVFVGAGAIKLIQSRDQLAGRIGAWVYDFPAPLIKPLGLVEVLGAIGLIVPPVVDNAPILAPVAASGLVVIMIGAIIIHSRRDEYRDVSVNVLLAIMAGVVAWGRFGPHAF
ncbi:DoxX family protein [Mycobacterium sp. pUA109]|uniref:DoxX family protein n=1 Tax=Mycobacterium sp. pUA109 TaxID=3238982 RepID=UPI00351B2A6D